MRAPVLCPSSAPRPSAARAREAAPEHPGGHPSEARPRDRRRGIAGWPAAAARPGERAVCPCEPGDGRLARSRGLSPQVKAALGFIRCLLYLRSLLGSDLLFHAAWPARRPTEEQKRGSRQRANARKQKYTHTHAARSAGGASPLPVSAEDTNLPVAEQDARATQFSQQRIRLCDLKERRGGFF